MRMLCLFVSVGFSLACSLPSARADYIFNVSIDTSGLSGDHSLHGPFGVDFQLNQGDGSVVNTATISNINLGAGGAAAGLPTLTGNASGGLPNTISLNDNGSFFNDFNQGFTPGSKLTFTVDLTTNGATTPDQFSFALLQNYGTVNVGEIATSDPSGANTVFTATLNSGQPAIVTYQGTNPNDTLSPDVQATPAPGSLVLGLLGAAGLVVASGWQRWRGAALV